MQTMFHILRVILFLFWQCATTCEGICWYLLWYCHITNTKCTTIFGLLQIICIKVVFSNTLLADTIAQWAKIITDGLIFRKNKKTFIASKGVHIANNAVHGENKWPRSIHTHKDKLFGNNSHIWEAINYPVTAGMTQHVAYFLLGTLKGQAAVHRSLLMYSLAMITSCHSHVGGQFVSTGPQSWGLRARNLSALSANCSRGAGFFFLIYWQSLWDCASTVCIVFCVQH